MTHLSGRKSDELTLEALYLRGKGMTLSRVADVTGISPGNIERRTNTVRNADLATPDASATPEQIEGCYW